MAATPTRRSEPATNVVTSVGVTPKSNPWRNRLRATAAAAPTPTPQSVVTILRPTMRPSTLRASAPRAMRSPISRVLQITEYAVTP